MSLGGVGSETNPGTPRIISPVWSEDPLESGNKIHVSAVFHTTGERFQLRSTVDETHTLCPLNGSTCDLDGAFQSILSIISNLVAHGGQQSIFRLDRFGTGVLEQETTCTISVFNLALSEHMT